MAMATRRGRGWRAGRCEHGWSNEEEARALSCPWERRAMDVLQGMLGLDVVSASEALEAIGRDAHGGWIDLLLEVKGLHLRWGIAHLWEEVLRGCMAASGEDLRMARNDACRAPRPVTILRPSRWSATTGPHAYPASPVRRRAAFVRHWNTGRARAWSSQYRASKRAAGPRGNLAEG